MAADDDAHGVPVVTMDKMEQLANENAFVDYLESSVLAADCGIIKVRRRAVVKRIVSV